ncbi:FxSxx-COOH system tetratricopeptide repeat protein [Phytohabitans suffuscus]|uniref:ATP/GTP-binding protein n=1 Tax=Phytohabitans suffuscus TaxID=624315 RepID=A0A6F8YP75_9ACTN|nr:FxSxx-COOH system tetratricopeptide repeat protein [Phytohabitans suffuscus]BCB87975.1 hypothetical protein Psuf_052880 [Phytohabitans suffuscus]
MTDGQIVTFYSYKGGTGRTMALANVAWILASNGKRVLAVDWDLESPGLHRYFHPFLADKKLRSSRGVIDLIRDFAAAAMDPQTEVDDPQWHRRYADVEREAVSLAWRFPGFGVIDLLPAGQQDPSYSSAVSTFDWPAFYERLNGGAFLQALRDNMRQHYDYVLIDSRTGLSDTAGICTVQLPDTVVDCFTLSEQSIDGAVSVADSVANQRAFEPIRIRPVPMRVEDAEQVKLEAGRDYARARFGPYLGLDPEAADRYWGDVEIPYKPFFAYEEILAVFGERSRQENSLLAAFERLTRALTDGAVAELPPIDERERRRLLGEYERTKAAAVTDVLISYSSTDRTWGEWIGEELRQAGLRVLPQQVDFALDPADPAGVLEHVESVNRVLVLLSRDYVKAPNAAEFWRLVAGRDQAGGGRFLVSVRLDGARVPVPFGDRQPVVDFGTLSEDRAREALLTAFGLPYPPARVERRPAQERMAPRYPATQPPVWNVPQRNSAFTGRALVLEGLRNRLAASVTVVVPQALYGLGGVGKTQVALEYAHRFAADYDIVWWISAEEAGVARAALAELATRMGLPEVENVSERVELVLDALRRGEPTRRWLLIYDNADEPEAIQPYLPQGTGHVLLTSRNAAWSRQASAVEVGAFSRAESVALLRRRVDNLSEDDAYLLADRLGDLPLAIEQAGAWLATTAMPVDRYLELLDTRLPQVLAENPPPGYQRTAAATWLLSLERLRDDMPAAAKLLELCAFFGPEPIPMRLINSERFVQVLLPFDPALNEPLLQGRLVQEIGRYALASVDTGHTGIQLHRLVQAVIRDRLPEEERAANRRHVHEILAAANPKTPDNPAEWADYRQLLRHLRASGALESTVPTVRQLVIDMVAYLGRISDYQASQEQAEDALAAWRAALPGPDDLTTLWLRVHLANALRSQAKYTEAHAVSEATQQALVGSVGPDHPYVIACISGRAADLRGLGRYAEAKALDEEALERSKRVLGPNANRTINAINNVAISLLFVGDFAGATSLSEQAFNLRRDGYGPKYPTTLQYAHNYARCLREVGRYGEARDLLAETLVVLKEVRGEDNPHTLRTAKTLAVTLRKLGDITAAHALTQETLARLDRVLGRTHTHTLACVSNLACDQSALGDDRAARRTAEEALARYRQKFGSDHLFTLACENNLAIFLRRLGDHDSYPGLSQRVVERLRTSLGPHHPYTLACQVNLANEHYDLGDYAAALDADETAYTGMASRAALGRDHPDTIAAGNNLAISRRVTGDRAGGQELLQDVLARSVRVLGSDHLNTIAIRNGVRLNCDIDPPEI